MLEIIREIERSQKVKELHILNNAIIEAMELVYNKGNDNVINTLAMLNSQKDRLIEKMKEL